MGRIAVRVAVLLGVLAISLGTAQAQSPDAFYRGKNVALVIGYSVGGGYDTYGRLLARHLGRHIPGNPSIVPQNMPGAGSQKSLEYILNHAPKDGLTIGTFSRSLAIAPLIENAKYDPRRLEWVGSISTDSTVCVAWHQSGIKTWDDMKTKQFTVGGLGRGSDPEIYAMERGEVQGMCGYSYSSLRGIRKAWIDEGKVSIMMQGALAKDPSIPDHVPLLLDKAADERQRKALELILAPQTVARPFALPPGTPADRIDAMRKAFMATMADPEFLADAKKAGLEVSPLAGERIAELYAKVYETPKDIVEIARKAVGN